MRNSLILALAIAAGTVTVPAQISITPNTLKLEEGQSPPAASASDLTWMAGYWRGTGLGGVVDEIWSVAEGGSMIGAFRLLKEDKMVFSEALMISPAGESLVLKVKHFTPEFVGWEEKADSVDFPLVRLEPNKAYFRGLTFVRDGDKLSIYLVLTQKDGSKREESFDLQRYRP